MFAVNKDLNLDVVYSYISDIKLYETIRCYRAFEEFNYTLKWMKNWCVFSKIVDKGVQYIEPTTAQANIMNVVALWWLPLQNSPWVKYDLDTLRLSSQFIVGMNNVNIAFYFFDESQ